ncbi:NAD(P)/FAD-dependent oxidoreductase [Ralstonia solanacearum]|uniref:Amine oxidase domain-containing protein n=1 Tax=Ralstonia solanacearum TaxID=305 RepID=A0AAD0S849_RALSL|nr:NAD(P)/FAD-dependent oxidoreductase [Ralstonia solanacearum]AXV82543.1 hypothetical protein CJO77_14020 [Ralstonia solanacearum]AXW53665.1 hypothetical protein CJO92_14015 [Ralstonia solanacearum]
MTQPSIAIVGAGIAGVACANALAAEGIAVTVYERSGGVGGRLATVVLPEGAPAYAFDHGAQSFNVRTEAFRRAVDAARRQGLVMPWPARWGHRTAEGLLADTRDETRYVGQPGMSALVRSLATPLDVRFGHAVTRVAQTDKGWTLHRSGANAAQADMVVLALPAPELPALFDEGGTPATLRDTIAPVRYAPCWALMMGFAQPLPLPYDGIRIDDDMLAWAARDNTKPGRVMVDESWVVHASPGWSAAHAGDTPEQALHAMHARFAEAFPGTPEPTVLAAHLWPHALVEQSAGTPCHWDAASRLGACGDWCEGPRVEAAFLSGVALAAKIAEAL